MAKILFKQGRFKILAEDMAKLSSDKINKLIRTAGATCYQARETIKKTPEEFITMIRSRGHFSVLEHSWYCYAVYPRQMDMLEKIGYQFYQANNLFSITEDRKRRCLIVSGNARMFNEAYARDNRSPVLSEIIRQLNLENSILFPLGDDDDFSLRIFDGKVEINPELISPEERLAHIAMCVEFNQHCRGFTHEHVRHRLASFSQESTRYVDYAKGDVNLDEFQMQFVLPYNDEFDFLEKIEFVCNGETYRMSPVDFTGMIEAFYRGARKAGLKPEEARQWLPIGLKSQIVTTANLKEWRHWFYMRASKFAHPEIRWTALNLLRFCKERWPDLFDDFQIAEDEKSAKKI
ncbi:MAG: FAD-dependent thymidylate synthase [Patescibacteria group bacterium]